MLNVILYKVLGGATLALALFLWGVHIGNTSGSNAKLVARIQAELATTNAVLHRQLAEDAAIAAREVEAEDRAEKEFAAAAAHLTKCPVSRETANVLNKIGGG